MLQLSERVRVRVNSQAQRAPKKGGGKGLVGGGKGKVEIVCVIGNSMKHMRGATKRSRFCKADTRRAESCVDARLHRVGHLLEVSSFTGWVRCKAYLTSEYEGRVAAGRGEGW